MKRLYKEPLVHFLLLGALLFGVFTLVNDEDSSIDTNRIEVTIGDIDRLTKGWTKRWNRAPTESELQGLVDSYIKEEVYYREALALGLDREDTIIRRRMMQKLEFLTNDITALNIPDDTELNKYFLENQGNYQQPAQLSFFHIYFSHDNRGQNAIKDASNVLTKIAESSANSIDVSNYGDSFMLQKDFELVTQDEVTRLFGEEFSEQLLRTPVAKWQGPIKSAYGLHLVRIDKRIDAHIPALSSVIDKVRTDWVFEHRQKANAQMYQVMKNRYEIFVEDMPGQPGVARIPLPGEASS